MKRKAALLIILVSAAACMTGCTKNTETFTPKSYTAEAGEITEVCIDVRDRQIEVIPSPDNQVRIDYYENSKEYYKITVSESHSLTMTAESNKDWTDYIGGKSASGSRNISLQLPDNLIKSLNLSTTNKDILLPPLTIAGNINLSTQGGSIIFNKLNVENTINLKAKNGDINGSIIGSYDDYAITSDIKKGKSNLPSDKENGSRTLTISNNNGNTDIEFITE